MPVSFSTSSLDQQSFCLHANRSLILPRVSGYCLFMLAILLPPIPSDVPAMLSPRPWLSCRFHHFRFHLHLSSSSCSVPTSFATTCFLMPPSNFDNSAFGLYFQPLFNGDAAGNEGGAAAAPPGYNFARWSVFLAGASALALGLFRLLWCVSSFSPTGTLFGDRHCQFVLLLFSFQIFSWSLHQSRSAFNSISSSVSQRI